MSRPDARLLVPVTCLPFVPAGARAWLMVDGAPVAAACIVTLPWSGGLVVVADEAGHADAHPSALMRLDLSAPDLRDGVPERLDVLPWALRVLHPEARTISRPSGQAVALHADSSRHYVHTIIAPPYFGVNVTTLDPWPDLADLSPDDASRAVVAAALRQRVTP